MAIFLAALLILSHHTFPIEYVDLADDYLRALMFMVIAFVVATSSERIAKAQEEREHFLKETSHRIITPVAIIGGYIDLLLESSNLDDDQKEKIRIIRERNEEVQKLVKDALAGRYLEEGEEEG